MQNVMGGDGKNIEFQNNSNLSCYQLIIECYNSQMLYVGLMVTITENSTKDRQKIKKSMHTTQKNHQIIKEKNKKRKKEQRNYKQPENN